MAGGKSFLPNFGVHGLHLSSWVGVVSGCHVIDFPQAIRNVKTGTESKVFPSQPFSTKYPRKPIVSMDIVDQCNQYNDHSSPKGKESEYCVDYTHGVI